MARNPDWSKHRPDSRFDAYRGMIARLFRGEEEVGLLLVRVEPYAEVVSGRLWWSRWSDSFDMLWLFSIVDGNFSDTLVPAERAEAELQDWSQGRYEHYGEVLRAVWVSVEESDRLRQSEFGLEHA